ncbi:hypothetical protein [Azospirillum sp. TSH100]|uniref:hypothetical protein n=1 Tax=Azospirillum sp. TSH100 TaxID=652764 RepID=UPI001304BD9E|nr:hypothetical protein [Azospirillum sp. TSH100]
MCGLLVLLLSAGRLNAEWLLLRSTTRTVQSSPAGFADGLSREAARSGVARAAAAAAALRLAGLQGAASPAEREELLGAAVADLHRTLLGAPLAAATWERLAFAEQLRHRPLDAARAWRMAVVAGAFDPSAMPRRLQSGFALWPFMDADGRDAMDLQVRSFFAWGPGSVTELAVRFGGAEIVRHGLAADPAAAADFERRLRAFAQ